MALNTVCGTITETYNSSNTCNDSNGGVETVYFGNISEISAVTISTGFTYTTFSMSGTAKAYEYSPFQYTTIADTDGTKNEFGATKYLVKMTTQLLGLSTEAIQKAKKINKSRIFAIVKYNNGKYFVLGLSEIDATAPRLSKGLTTTAVNIKGGQKLDDFNGVELQLEYAGSSPMIEIDAATVAAIVQTA